MQIIKEAKHDDANIEAYHPLVKESATASRQGWKRKKTRDDSSITVVTRAPFGIGTQHGVGERLYYFKLLTNPLAVWNGEQA